MKLANSGYIEMTFRALNIRSSEVRANIAFMRYIEQETRIYAYVVLARA